MGLTWSSEQSRRSISFSLVFVHSTKRCCARSPHATEVHLTFLSSAHNFTQTLCPIVEFAVTDFRSKAKASFEVRNLVSPVSRSFCFVII